MVQVPGTEVVHLKSSIYVEVPQIMQFRSVQSSDIVNVEKLFF
jgi:hypothetical protein